MACEPACKGLAAGLVARRRRDRRMYHRGRSRICRKRRPPQYPRQRLCASSGCQSVRAEQSSSIPRARRAVSESNHNGADPGSYSCARTDRRHGLAARRLQTVPYPAMHLPAARIMLVTGRYGARGACRSWCRADAVRPCNPRSMGDPRRCRSTPLRIIRPWPLARWPCRPGRSGSGRRPSHTGRRPR